MTKLGLSATTSIATVLGFALGLVLDAPQARGQRSEGVAAAPRAFLPEPIADGSEYAGLEYDPHGFSSSHGRAGSIMPVTGAGALHDGEIIYQGRPRFIGQESDSEMSAEGAEMIDPPSEGEIIYESGPHDMGMLHGGGHACESCDGGGCASCDVAGDCGSCGSWEGCGRPDCEECIPLCLPRFKYLSVFGGVQGFKGPRDNGTDSNFGFHEGVQIAGRAPFIGRRGFGYQLGYRATQSRLHGTTNSQEGRMQHFFTGGLYRRSCVGLQYGAAYDLLRDDLTEEIDFSQLRGEVSVLGPRGGEVGFTGMFHLSDDGIANNTFEPVDQYLFFYRKRFENCGEGRLWAGLSDEDDGIFGGEFMVPLDDRWSLAGGFNYLIPEDDTVPNGAIQEAWNIGLSVVWHWNCQARAAQGSPFRPLFNVADNGTMIIDRP